MHRGAPEVPTLVKLEITYSVGYDVKPNQKSKKKLEQEITHNYLA